MRRTARRAQWGIFVPYWVQAPCRHRIFPFSVACPSFVLRAAPSATATLRVGHISFFLAQVIRRPAAAIVLCRPRASSGLELDPFYPRHVHFLFLDIALHASNNLFLQRLVFNMFAFRPWQLHTCAPVIQCGWDSTLTFWEFFSLFTRASPYVDAPPSVLDHFFLQGSPLNHKYNAAHHIRTLDFQTIALFGF